MTTKEMFAVLNETDEFGEQQQRLLKQYLAEQVERYDRGDDVPNDIAYEIAGLMSANSVWQLPNDDPFMKVMLLAGSLELPDPHHGPGESWDELKRLIIALP